MKRLCVACGRSGVPPNPVRTHCEDCRERILVRTHQLHLRRGVRTFRGHGCALCRRHRALIADLKRRWDERDVWVWKRCPKGHRWMKDRESQVRCPLCAYDRERRMWARRAKHRRQA